MDDILILGLVSQDRVYVAIRVKSRKKTLPTKSFEREISTHLHVHTKDLSSGDLRREGPPVSIIRLLSLGYCGEDTPSRFWRSLRQVIPSYIIDAHVVEPSFRVVSTSKCSLRITLYSTTICTTIPLHFKILELASHPEHFWEDKGVDPCKNAA